MPNPNENPSEKEKIKITNRLSEGMLGKNEVVIPKTVQI
jgi:hypothetical protein